MGGVEHIIYHIIIKFCRILEPGFIDSTGVWQAGLLIPLHNQYIFPLLNILGEGPETSSKDHGWNGFYHGWNGFYHFYQNFLPKKGIEIMSQKTSWN